MILTTQGELPLTNLATALKRLMQEDGDQIDTGVRPQEPPIATLEEISRRTDEHAAWLRHIPTHLGQVAAEQDALKTALEFEGIPKPAAVNIGENKNPLTQEANRQG